MMQAAPPRQALELRLPRVDEEREFLRAHWACAVELPHFLHAHDEGMPFVAYLQRLRELARAAVAPETFLFAFAGARIVGRIAIRHQLAPERGHLFGHVGYAVLPEFRNRGHATAMLAQAVGIARGELGIARVLVTCDDDNLASIKVIERNGGVLQDTATDPSLPKPKRRYWIG